MRLVYIGPPGSGKGTQAKRLAERRGWAHIATGDLLREAVARGTPVGRRAESLMRAGLLVPDDVVIGVIEERLAADDEARGFIMDGFPRTVGQAEALDRLLGRSKRNLNAALLFELPDEAIVERITGRRSCPVCQAPYHVRFVPPRTPGICDRDGAALMERPDDSEEKVRTRLARYHEETEPLIPYYDRLGLLRQIDASPPPDEVFMTIVRLVDDL